VESSQSLTQSWASRVSQDQRYHCEISIHPGPDSKIMGMMSVAWPSLVILLSELRKACQQPPFQRRKTKKHFTVLFSCTASRILVSVHSQLLLIGRPNLPSTERTPWWFFFFAETPTASLLSYFRSDREGSRRRALLSCTIILLSGPGCIPLCKSRRVLCCTTVETEQSRRRFSDGPL
jgi:hypothetical protein